MVTSDQQSSWAIDELQSVDACPACGMIANAYRYESLRDQLEGVPGTWDIRGCDNCGSLFLDPRPTPEAIGKAYETYFTHVSAANINSADNGDNLIWRLANGYMNAHFGMTRQPTTPIGKYLVPAITPLKFQLDYFCRHMPKIPGSVLDVGCGNGLFLLRAREAGWKTYGIDPDPAAAAQAREVGLEVDCGSLDTYTTPELFDVVTCSHVIEHVHQPSLFLRQMSGVLKSGGMLWLATPNARSSGLLRYGKAWRGLEPPRHLILFSAKALHRLLSEAGFVKIRFKRRGRGSRYTLRISDDWAKRYGLNKRRLSPLWVDLRASIFATAGEELVVTAVRP